MKIDWSKAPEGATHWEPASDSVVASWMRREGARWFYWPADSQGSGHPSWVRAGTIYDSRVARFIPRLTEWSGKGLPPVGTICEANVPQRIHRMSGVTGYAWRKVEVCKSGIPGAEGECLVYDLETTGSCWADEFRPLRTPEQIAAEERDSAINQMIGFVKDHPGGRHVVHHLAQLQIQEEACRDLYDAGYRKIPKAILIQILELRKAVDALDEVPAPTSGFAAPSKQRVEAEGRVMRAARRLVEADREAGRHE